MEEGSIGVLSLAEPEFKVFNFSAERMFRESILASVPTETTYAVLVERMKESDRWVLLGTVNQRDRFMNFLLRANPGAARKVVASVFLEAPTDADIADCASRYFRKQASEAV
jgi:hypothetical protein